jgi:type I restriction enzyme S subunit
MDSRVEYFPSGFKTTEIGELPEEWEIVVFRDIVNEITSGDWGNETSGGGLEPCFVIRGTDFKSAIHSSLVNTPIRFVKTSSIYKRKLIPDDILIELSGGSKDQPTGRVLRINDDLVSSSQYPILFSNFVKRLRLKTECLSEFFQLFWDYLYLNGSTRTYEKRTTGIRNFRLDDFLSSEFISLPPLPEQRAIANVLSTIQRAIEAQDKVISAAREMKRSLMRHLFTYGPVQFSEIDRVPVKETEVGLMPDHWEVTDLGSLVDIQYGVQAAVANLKDPTKGIPILTNINITNEGKLDLTLLRYYELKPDQRDKLLIQKGDLLFNWRSGSASHVGKTALFDISGEYTYSSFILRFRPNIQIGNAYLHYFLSHLKAIDFFAEKRSQSSINSVFNASLSSKIPIAVAPISDQAEIVGMLSAINNKIQSEENRKASLQTLFKTMLHLLMTGQLRVNNLKVDD